MSSVYFISDAHLGLGSKEAEQKKEHRLAAFIDSIIKDAEQLFIVGDLFDAWFEYRSVIPKGFHRIITKLEDCTRSGIRVHYLAGNHDYWMRDFFREEIGINIYRNAFEVLIQGKKIFVHHGDGLSANDTGYKILKSIFRNPVSIWLYSWLHPDLGMRFARFSSKKSRKYTANKHYGEEDGMKKFASAKIREGYDIIVMGHRHRPACEQIGKGLYINLGDWITHNSYAVMKNGNISLKQWEM